jgi:hypothetical protein
VSARFATCGNAAFNRSAVSRDICEDLVEVCQRVSGPLASWRRDTLSSIESAVKGLTAANCAKTLADAGVTSEVLSAAASLKRLAGQVNVAIHATGILLCLPHILKRERPPNMYLWERATPAGSLTGDDPPDCNAMVGPPLLRNGRFITSDDCPWCPDMATSAKHK